MITSFVLSTVNADIDHKIENQDAPLHPPLPRLDPFSKALSSRIRQIFNNRSQTLKLIPKTHAKLIRVIRRRSLSGRRINFQQQIACLDDVARMDVHRFHHAVLSGRDQCFHLHRLQRQQGFAGDDALPHLHGEA